jgi:hypothetical protein
VPDFFAQITRFGNDLVVVFSMIQLIVLINLFFSLNGILDDMTVIKKYTTTNYIVE